MNNIIKKPLSITLNYDTIDYFLIVYINNIKAYEYVSFLSMPPRNL